jgi:hypothetical protein
MTQLYFIFNHYFNNLFLEPKNYLTQVEIEKGLEFATKFHTFWTQYENKVFTQFESYGLNLPSEWHIYFVYSKGQVFPMSSPLILQIKEDMYDITATLIHELAHLMLLTDNMRGQNRFYQVWDYLYQEFKGESNQVIEHLIVNTIVKNILTEIFAANEIAKIISYEKTLFGEGLARAWSILEAQEKEIKLHSHLSNSFLKLKYNPNYNYLPEEKLF